MIKGAALFLTMGLAVVVTVTVVMGLAWLAVAIPLLIATAAGYGLLSLTRHCHVRRTKAHSADPHARRA
jgi:hypothetical protein